MSESYTPQMWMDDLERFGAGGPIIDRRRSPHARFLLHPLQAAVLHGRVDVVEFMLHGGYDKDELDEGGRTPLHAASHMGFVDAVQVLLAAGADVGLRCSSKDMSALDRAAGLGHVHAARMIIEHGAGVNSAGIDDPPLHFAVLAETEKAEMVSMLLAMGAGVDTKDNSRSWTALFFAALQGRLATTQALLSAGASVDLRCALGMSALDVAACEGHVDVLRAVLEHGADMNSAEAGGMTALHIAARNSAAAVDVLVEAGANTEAKRESTGSTPLHEAAMNGNLATALVLLRRGASINPQNAAGFSPLHCVATRATEIEIAQLLDLLLRWGADEKAFTTSGRTVSDIVDSQVGEHGSSTEDVDLVRKLLASAPADRAWRRRGFLVMCRAHYPARRVQLGCRRSHTHHNSIAKRTRSHPQPSRAEIEWAGVASMLMGVGADPISLMGDGADIIFHTIVEFL